MTIYFYFYLESNGENGYEKTEMFEETWTRSMRIKNLKKLIEEKKFHLSEDQKVFCEGVLLEQEFEITSDLVKYSKLLKDKLNLMFQDVFDVIVSSTDSEAGVMSNLDQDVWIVTGSGTNFTWYPIPANSKNNKPDLKSKDLIPMIKRNIHFLLAFKGEMSKIKQSSV